MRGGSKQETKTRAKSIEDFDYAWIEEAQSPTEELLDLFFPSIRKKGSKIVCTWNPFLGDEDPVFKKINGSSFGKIISINYYDNPMLDQEEILIAEELKEKDYKKYEHIYLGTRVNLDGLCYPTFERERHVLTEEESLKLVRSSDSHIVGVDWGYNHPMAMTLIYRTGERYLIYRDYRLREIVINARWLFDDFYSFARDAKTAICDSARPELIDYCDRGYMHDTKVKHETRFEPCSKYPGSVLDEIHLVNNLFMKDRLFICENATNILDEIIRWMWKEGAKKEIPEELGEDALRSMGYGLMYYEKGSQPNIKMI
jgi:PBSX family phage terminase large subunit